MIPLIGGNKQRAYVSDAPRLVTTISMSKVCLKCMLFCMETKQLMRFGEAAARFKATRKMPHVKVFCKNGCHEKPDWGWRDIMDPVLNHKHIPRR